jgi:hypothetical protein
VAGGVGQDEGAARRREEPVGDVDRDALLALRAQAVRDEREVQPTIAALRAGPHDGFHLILEDRLGVVQQTADERALAVVDRAGGGDAQQLGRRLERLRHGLPAVVLERGHQK